MLQLGANFSSLAEIIGATRLPTELQRQDCNLQREETFTGAKAPRLGADFFVLPTV
jgi:hypothetical protein